MIYSEVVKSGWILPKKTKYTKHDVNNILTDSLFGKYRANSTLTEKEAKFICKCSAAYHDTDYSVYVKNIKAGKLQLTFEEKLCTHGKHANHLTIKKEAS